MKFRENPPSEVEMKGTRASVGNFPKGRNGTTKWVVNNFVDDLNFFETDAAQIKLTN